jgi:uncharacterized coiled-coil protein SlyX
MPFSTTTQPAPDAVSLWLKRLAFVAAIALLAVSAWCVWRVSMIAYQVETAVVAISADVKRMSRSGAQISAHLEKLDERLQSLEQKALDAVKLDEIESVLSEIDVIRNPPPAAGGGPSADTEREIKHLLGHIRSSKHRFVYSDENKGGLRFYLQLYAKYKAYESVLSSADAFIDKVATKSLDGKQYDVVINGDETVPLSDWLTEELQRYRSSEIAAESAP